MNHKERALSDAQYHGGAVRDYGGSMVAVDFPSQEKARVWAQHNGVSGDVSERQHSDRYRMVMSV